MGCIGNLSSAMLTHWETDESKTVKKLGRPPPRLVLHMGLRGPGSTQDTWDKEQTLRRRGWRHFLRVLWGAGMDGDTRSRVGGKATGRWGDRRRVRDSLSTWNK